jgi:pimeloyl-ACP methyl ester carboxylesterase
MSSSAELVVSDVALAGRRWRVAARLPSGDGRTPLLLCNGIGVNWQAFEPLLAALGDRPLVAFDAPGVGASQAPARPYTLAGLAEQVQALLAALGVHRYDVLGVSWGGALAQQLALLGGSRCRRAVLAATSTGALSFPGRIGALLQLADAGRFHGTKAGRARELAQAYGGRVRNDLAALADFQRRLLPPSAEGYRCQLAAVAGWTSLPWLPWLQQHTLLLAGRDDPLVPLPNAWLMHGLLRRSSLHVVDDGHLLLHTGAAELGPRIATFLDG